MTGVQREVCVDSVTGLHRAVAGGADRIEICSALSIGGLTPSPGLIEAAAKVAIPVRAMIRPRSGDFVFVADETTQMLADIEAVLDAGLAGVVLGASTMQGDLDIDVLKQLRDKAGTMGATLHRVIDLVTDIPCAIEHAVSLGFDTILSSGGALTALAGIKTLSDMVLIENSRIEIMPGSGVNDENAETILGATDANWLHSSCSIQVSMPPELTELGFCPAQLNQTDVEKTKALAAICHGFST